jgi:glycerol-3-phosphate dehydrogenase (NAD(P)+)
LLGNFQVISKLQTRRLKCSYRRLVLYICTLVSTVAVIGDGSWATALVKILTDNQIQVNWWMRDKDNLTFIREHHFNAKYLRSAHLHTSYIKFYADIHKACLSADIILFAIPAAFLEDAISPLETEELKGKILLSAIKGMEPGTDLIISDYLVQRFDCTPEQIAVVAGPCHAEEVAMERISYLTISSECEATAALIAPLLKRPNIYTHTLNDIVGVEYAAVLKNIYAIAAGIANGIGRGDNFKAVLISNACAEMEKFLTRVTPAQRVLTHSVYLGDLLVTAYSQHSRNRTFGNMIGHGYSVRSAQLEMNMIAEGYFAVKSIHRLIKKYEVEMPICEAVYMILYEKISPILEFEMLKGKLS